MQAAPLRRQLHAAPFLPFTVQLANGKTFRVEHPEMASLSDSGGILIVWKRGSDDYEIIHLGAINNLGIEVPRQKPKRSSAK